MWHKFATKCLWHPWDVALLKNCKKKGKSKARSAMIAPLLSTDYAQVKSWEYDMKGSASKCVEKYCKLGNISPKSLKKVATPCNDDHLISPEDMTTVGELKDSCSRIVLTALYLARNSRPDILWSVNSLAREVTRWTVA